MQGVRLLPIIHIIRLKKFCQIRGMIKGLLTAVLRCAEVVGKKVPFLCLYKSYCFFIYCYTNAFVFLENILIMLSSKKINITEVNAPYALSGKIL